MTGHRTYALGDVTLQSGAVLKNAQLAYTTYGTLNAAARQCRSSADLLYRHACPQRSSVRAWTRHRSRPPFRGFGQSVRQRLLVIAKQLGSAARRPALSAGDAVRQRRLPASPADGSPRRSAHCACPRLVSGGDASLSMGGAVSRHGRGDPALLRRRALLPHQPCVSRRAEGSVAGRCRLERRRLFNSAGKGLARLRPRLRRLGLFARLLSRPPLLGAWLRYARGFRARLGGGSLEMGRERSPRQDLDVAAWRHQRQSDLSRRFQPRLAVDRSAGDRHALLERHVFRAVRQRS